MTSGPHYFLYLG